MQLLDLYPELLLEILSFVGCSNVSMVCKSLREHNQRLIHKLWTHTLLSLGACKAQDGGEGSYYLSLFLRDSLLHICTREGENKHVDSPLPRHLFFLAGLLRHRLDLSVEDDGRHVEPYTFPANFLSPMQRKGNEYISFLSFFSHAVPITAGAWQKTYENELVCLWRTCMGERDMGDEQKDTMLIRRYLTSPSYTPPSSLKLTGFPRYHFLPLPLSTFTSLTSLDLSRNFLTNLPSEVAHMKSLSTLSLQCNHLFCVCAEIGELTSLTFLDLSKNLTLSHIPPEIARLSNLKHLLLSDNYLLTLPDTLGSLSRLVTLDARSNKLSSLPPSLSLLPSLTSLDLENNCLLSFPVELRSLPRLRHLRVEYNKFTEVPEDMLHLTEFS